MKLTRRDFLKVSGAATAGLALNGMGIDFSPVEAYAWELRTRDAKETPTICCYCAVGCGILCHTDKKTGKVIYTEGDADNPINGGALCAKGASVYQLAQNDKRIVNVLYRAPNSDKWQVKKWDWALKEIAKRVKKTRDASFVEKNEQGQVVNRCNAIASVGSAAFLEKEGSISNSGRRAQWRYKAQEPAGMSKPDGDIIYELFLQIRELYAKDKKAKFPDPIFNLKWDYATEHKFDPHLVAKTINGYWTKDTTAGDKTYKKGEQVAAFAMLEDDGSTACGNWIYCQSYNQDGNNMARRDKTDPSGIGLYPKWSWAWPVNRRIIYNRASVDPAGRPWDPKRTVVEYVADIKDGKYLPGGAWKGDVPDGPWPPLKNPDGSAREDGKLAFIMKPDGYASLFGPGLKDGPFPEHYEPLECPVDKQPFGAQLTNPVALTFKTDKDVLMSCDPRFPFVGTTYRVTEHWQTGVLSRYVPWLIEAEPQVFVEMSEQLAGLKAISNGEKVIVQSPRGSLEAVAIVTKRLKPFIVQGQEVHLVGLPWHFGWIYPKDGGDSANLLTPSVGDPNTRIPESKAFMVNVLRKGA